MYRFIMNANYWVRSVLIVVVFVCLSGAVIASTGSKTITDNWPIYQCNPAVIPFAAQFAPAGLSADEGGVTTESNFQFCVQNTMGSFSDTLTQPMDYLTSQSGNVLDGVLSGMSGIMDQITSITDLFGSTGTSLFSSITNVVMYATILITKLEDAQAKMSAIIVSVLNTLSTSNYTILSIWNGTVGTLIKDMGNVAAAF
jgi:hypothetical protein